MANCSERYPKGFDLVPKEVTLNDYSSNRRGKRIARELHDGYKKDRDPRVYWAVGVGDTGFEVAPNVADCVTLTA